MKKSIVAIAAAGALFLSACGHSNSGIIAEKEIERGKVCSTSHALSLKPRRTNIPDTDSAIKIKKRKKKVRHILRRHGCSEYEFEVQYDNGDVQEFDVSRREYDRYRVGDRYPR